MNEHDFDDEFEDDLDVLTRTRTTAKEKQK